MANTKITSRVIADNAVGIPALAVSDGSNGQVLTTNGSGTLSFSTVSGTTINNNADNRVITGSGTANTLEGEANLIFDGTSLGVGTTSPTAYNSSDKLALVSSGNTSLAIAAGTSGESSIFMADGTSSTAPYMGYLQYHHSDNHLRIGVNAAERMRITSGGNVGIGTTSPATALHVNSAGSGDKAKIGNGTRDAFFACDSSGVSLGNEASQAGELLYLNQSSGYVSIFTNGGERQKIDSSGNITAPNQPSFFAYMSANFSIGVGSTKYTLDSVQHNTGSHYSTSTGKFTAPVAGKYLFLCNLAINNTGANPSYLSPGIRVNNSSIYYNGWDSKMSGTGYISNSNQIIIELSANDYVEFYIELSTSVTGIGNAGYGCTFHGQLLS